MLPLKCTEYIIQLRKKDINTVSYLKIESLITVKNKDKSTKLVAKCFNRFCLASARGAYGKQTKIFFKKLVFV